MSYSIAAEREMLLALKNSGMESEMIEQFLESLRSGRTDKGKRILSSHRSRLLSDVHAKQEELYCMDFLCRKLRNIKTSGK